MAETNSVSSLNRQVTDNLKLICPQGNEAVDVADFQHNFEILDTAYGTLVRQGDGVRWDDITDKPVCDDPADPSYPTSLAFHNEVPDKTTVDGWISEYVGTDLPDTINSLVTTSNTHTNQIANHETRISSLENNPPASSLNDLTDVTIDTSYLQGGNVIGYDVNQQIWRNGLLSVGCLSEIYDAEPEGGEIIKYLPLFERWTVSKLLLSDLFDVEFSAPWEPDYPHDGDVLMYDGENEVWKNGKVDTGLFVQDGLLCCSYEVDE